MMSIKESKTLKRAICMCPALLLSFACSVHMFCTYIHICTYTLYMFYALGCSMYEREVDK